MGERESARAFERERERRRRRRRRSSLFGRDKTRRRRKTPSPSYGDDVGPRIMTLKYRRFSSEGDAEIPGAASLTGFLVVWFFGFLVFSRGERREERGG
jgi:hypothetical protein